MHGFAIPELIEVDRPLMAIEMTLVRPPFLLDFGKVYLSIGSRLIGMMPRSSGTGTRKDTRISASVGRRCFR
jgi:hypothetical protein